MTSRLLLKLSALGLAALALVTALLAYAILGLQSKITKRLEKGWVLTPLELYSQGHPLSPGRRLARADLERDFAEAAWQPERDFGFGHGAECTSRLGIAGEIAPELECAWLRDPALALTFDREGWIRGVWRDGESRDHVSLFPKLITQFFDGQPILQQNAPLGEIPLACLQATTAIEDRDFLEHRGVSATGTVRAMLRNLRARRFAEGGSTITQQLVKNFFLTAKKTLRRKLEEQALAVLLEGQIGKDQILEMYLNVIYMGQSGPYQVRGFGSAARAIFDRSLSDLELPECALLAAMINSPGRYSPFEHPAAARARRELVLNKMRESGMITDRDVEGAVARPLPTRPPPGRVAHAPYFVTSALREFENWDLDGEEGVKLFTTLDPAAQSALSRAVADVGPRVESKLRRRGRQPLQIAALTVDVRRAEILALVGGRDFHASPYNRATDARRQIGSLIKPFVYLPAMKTADPLTPVLDQPFEWKVGRQTWAPRNFEKTSLGPVPYFFALAHSLNVPTAKIGREVGLDVIAETLRRAGIRTAVPRLPSLTLGAFELSLAEIAQGFVTLARLGHGEYVHTLERVEGTAGETLFKREPTSDLYLEETPTAVVNGMLRQVVDSGTARAVRAAGLVGEYAGKTGTTSDTKDAWFIGFDGRLLTAVWVGFDDNAPLGLTGASAALPVWIEVTKNLRQHYELESLKIPPGAEERDISRDELSQTFPNLPHLPERLRLTFTRR